MLLTDGTKYLLKLIRDNIQHKDYKRVNDLAYLYRQLITGENIDELLKQFVRRESAELFAQRKALTNHIVTSVSKGLMDVSYKVPRSTTAKRVVTYEDDKADEENTKLKDINKAIQEYWGTESLDDYMATRFIELNYTDPNSFVVTEFAEFDNTKEKAKPYPFEVSSKEAVDYAFVKNVLDYLIVKKTFTKEVRGLDGKVEEKTGIRYTLYLDKQTAQIEQVLEGEKELAISGGVPQLMEAELFKPDAPPLKDGLVFKLGENIYIYKEFTPHNREAVPAVRVGYVRDLVTNGRTCVNPFDAAVPYLRKTIKSNSELDLIMSLVAFPQQVSYENPCPNEKCFNGYTDQAGKVKCTTCGGTGTQGSSSVQDAIRLKMPKSKDELIPLQDIITYIAPDGEIIKLVDEYIEKTIRNARSIIFNTDIFDKKEIADTATGKNISLQNVYDALYPLAVKFSKTWKFIVYTIAKFTDLDNGLIASYTFSKDFKFKTKDELVQDLATANKSGADATLVNEINTDIARITYLDNPLEFQKYLVKQAFNPFAGKGIEEITLLLLSNHVPQRLKVQYSNLNEIFDALEIEKPRIYTLKRSEQKKLIDAQVQKLIKEAKADVPEPVLPLNDNI